MSEKHANVAMFIPHAGCPHACSFCNQRHISGEAAPPSAEQVREICERASAALCGGRFGKAEIAFFGGSFTAVDRNYMLSLLDAAAPFVENGSFSGIRVSTRPDAVDKDTAALLRRYYVSAVELGAQSMDDGVLAKNERGHTAEDVCRASVLIREAGLSLGLQMMTGLYGSDDERDRDTARALAALSPDTVRIYPTVALAHTRLAALYQACEYTPQTLDGAVALCAELLCFFEEEKGIPVIRLGLHAQDSLRENMVAGPWHPAFRELCEGLVYRRRMEALVSGAPPGEAVFRVHPSAVSRAVGHGRGNAAYFAQRGWQIRVVPDAAVPPGKVQFIT